jgi:hypothetical protein
MGLKPNRFAAERMRHVVNGRHQMSGTAATGRRGSIAAVEMRPAVAVRQQTDSV